MKQIVQSLIIAAAVALPSAVHAQSNLQSHAAYLPIDQLLDFNTIKPEVNVNLPKFLLKEAADGLDAGLGEDLTETVGSSISELIQEIHLIRVVVIEGEEAQKAAVVKGVKELRNMLEADWMSIVTVPNEGVGIYAKTDEDGATMQGLAALISEGNEAVIINVVGRIPLAKILKLVMAQDKFPADILQQIGNNLPGLVQNNHSPQSEDASDSEGDSEDVVN